MQFCFVLLGHLLVFCFGGSGWLVGWRPVTWWPQHSTSKTQFYLEILKSVRLYCALPLTGGGGQGRARTVIKTWAGLIRDYTAPGCVCVSLLGPSWRPGHSQHGTPGLSSRTGGRSPQTHLTPTLPPPLPPRLLLLAFAHFCRLLGNSRSDITVLLPLWANLGVTTWCGLL